MPAEVFHQHREFRIAAAVQERRHRALIAKIVHEPFAPGRATLKGQSRVKCVGAGIDPVTQGRAARFRKGRALQDAVFEADHPPAKGGKDRLDPMPEPFAHHAVQALAVVVDHPPDISQIVLPAFLQRLVDVALVEFRVSDQGDHPAFLAVPVMAAQVILRHGREDREGRAQADRAGREVDVIDVLGA